MRTLDDGATGTVRLGDLEVRRLGYGAARAPGARNAEGRRDRALAVAVVRRAVERGVNFIDTAAVYGFGECEEIIAEALHPYPADLVIASKAGFALDKPPPGVRELPRDGRPETIKTNCERSLRRLRRDVIDIYQSHFPDPDVPYADTIGAFAELRQEGKIRHVGLSNVTIEQLEIAQAICPVVSVQNPYNVGQREWEPVLERCAQQGIAFLPYYPVITGDTPAGALVETIAATHGARPQQVALAWLLQHSPVMLPIPGTSRVAHLDENVDAAWLTLSDREIALLNAAAPPSATR